MNAELKKEIYLLLTTNYLHFLRLTKSMTYILFRFLNGYLISYHINVRTVLLKIILRPVFYHVINLLTCLLFNQSIYLFVLLLAYTFKKYHI